MEPEKIKSSDFAGLVRPALEQTNAPRHASASSSGYGYEGNYGGGGENDNPSYGSGNPSYGSGNPSYGGDSYYGGGYKVYTVEEFYNWEGVWPGGYVEGMGYVVIDGEYTGDKPYYNYSYWPYPYLPEWASYYWHYYNKEYNNYYIPYYNHQYSYPEPPIYPGGGGGSGIPSPPTPQTDGHETIHAEYYLT